MQRVFAKQPAVAWALPTDCFLESKGRLKACVQVSDDLLYFRGHSPRYNLPVDWISDAQGRLKTQNLQPVLTSGSRR